MEIQEEKLMKVYLLRFQRARQRELVTGSIFRRKSMRFCHREKWADFISLNESSRDWGTDHEMNSVG